MENSSHKKLFVAGAGTGKTTMLLNLAIDRHRTHRVLYLTYTDANAREFKTSVSTRMGCVPPNITIMTWFSFLLNHGVRPFPACGFIHRIDGMLFNEREPRHPRGITRGQEKYYCPTDGMVYRTSLADLAALCDEQWGGEVTDRVCSIYGTILVDEGQDFAGYDYDLMLSLMNKSDEMIIVGDPRQQTYRTGSKAKNKNFANIFDFFQKRSNFSIDTSTLRFTHRCSADVMGLANKLYSSLPEVLPSEQRRQDPRGKVVQVKKDDFESWYLAREEQVTALVWNKSIRVPVGCRTLTMGNSKGLTLGDVAIFLTAGMKQWIKDDSFELPDMTRAKLYVAITRARGDLYLVL